MNTIRIVSYRIIYVWADLKKKTCWSPYLHRHLIIICILYMFNRDAGPPQDYQYSFAGVGCNKQFGPPLTVHPKPEHRRGHTTPAPCCLIVCVWLSLGSIYHLIYWRIHTQSPEYTTPSWCARAPNTQCQVGTRAAPNTQSLQKPPVRPPFFKHSWIQTCNVLSIYLLTTPNFTLQN